MSFEQIVKVPVERVGVVVGKAGSVKSEIEERCGVKLQIESDVGDVIIRSEGDVSELNPLKAVEVITAIARGFSPERAFRLFDEGATIDVIDLREYAGKSESSLKRIKGRIIGLEGRSRRVIEEFTGAYLSIYGHTVTVLGTVEQLRLAVEAIRLLSSGRTHKSVYNMLQRARARAKLERMKLWEDKAIE